MELKILSFSGREWDQIMAGFSGFNLLQSFAYGEVKASEGWKIERCLFCKGNEYLGGFQAVIKSVPFFKGGVVWVNRGPLAVDSALLPEMLSLLKNHYPAHYLRIALPYATEFSGFSVTSRLGWASGKLNLGPDLESIRRNLKQKWRNLLNKAEKTGQEIRSENEFANFIKEQDKFLQEKGFSTNLRPDFLLRLQESLPDEQKMLALNAYHDDKIIAGVLLARYGDCVEYLAGNLSNKGRDLGCGQLLLWRAIVWAKEAGAKEFDLGGMDELRTPPGIYHFKSGMSPVSYRLPPEIEFCPTNPLARLVRWRVERALGA